MHFKRCHWYTRRLILLPMIVVHPWISLFHKVSGVATGVARGAECHPWQRKICQKLGKNQEKSGKNQEKSGKKEEKIRKNREKEEKSGRNGNKQEISFTLPLLTDKAGYATATKYPLPSLLTKYQVIQGPKGSFRFWLTVSAQGEGRGLGAFSPKNIFLAPVFPS